MYLAQCLAQHLYANFGKKIKVDSGYSQLLTRFKTHPVFCGICVKRSILTVESKIGRGSARL